ncbi:MAG: hypothetical protein RLZZ541_919 [Pseudomonadota bacterium]|jgi:ElaB/YqjD/DUF883 family membrane-anchored ribosome-binding protein
MEPLSDQLNEDQLIRDFKSVVADVEALLKATANTGGDKLAEVRAKAETSLGVVKATMGDTQANLLAKTKETAKAADDYVQENPWRSIGLAASVGLVIGLLISRR